MSPWVRRAARYCAVLSVLGLALTATSSAHEESRHGSGRLDVVSSAQPTEQEPTVSDEAYVAKWADRYDANLDAVATGSATCDGCRAEARTVQVVDARHSRHVHADNVATAWSQCSDCGGSVVSVQVVLVRGHRLDLTANNRALALNTGCDACDTTSSAYQVVLSARGWVDLSALRDDVVAWVEAGQPADSGGAAPQRRSLAANPGEDRLAALSDLVSGDDATVVDRSVQVKDAG